MNRTEEQLKIHKVLDWVWKHKSRSGNQVEWYTLVEELIESGMTHRQVCEYFRWCNSQFEQVTVLTMRTHLDSAVQTIREPVSVQKRKNIPRSALEIVETLSRELCKEFVSSGCTDKNANKGFKTLRRAVFYLRDPDNYQPRKNKP